MSTLSISADDLARAKSLIAKTGRTTKADWMEVLPQVAAQTVAVAGEMVRWAAEFELAALCLEVADGELDVSDMGQEDFEVLGRAENIATSLEPSLMNDALARVHAARMTGFDTGAEGLV